MRNFQLNPVLACDSYKQSHVYQYDPKTTLVYSNFTPRKSRYNGINKVVFFGLQYFVQDYLIDSWNAGFFNRPKLTVMAECERILKNHLGPVKLEHFEKLYDLGYLPLCIKAVPEGYRGAINVPLLTVYNTHQDFYWLTNFIETIMSTYLWQACTTATIAYEFRKILEKYTELTCEDNSFIDFQGHDFSMRGMSSLETACISGAAHLLSFKGTDTIPAIPFLEYYYNANSDEEMIGVSVPASEHSVACLNSALMGEDLANGEFNFLDKYITEIYPEGIVSYVADSYDFWGVVTEFLPKLKDQILARDGKLVIRPDSGVPELILCGDDTASTEHERKGLIECLWDIFGGRVNSQGYKELNPKIGAIYGDSINLEREDVILDSLMQKGFAANNIVFGCGSRLYQLNTRDSLGFVVKATYAEVDRKPYNLFKSPKTGGWKASHKGLLRVNEDGTVTQECTWEEERGGILEDVFYNGVMTRRHTLAEIRKRLQNS